MAVVTWNDHIDVVEEGGVVYSKTHEEFTIVQWDELADIDVSRCLQGSIVYNITDGKIAVWDGTSQWIEQDGTAHDQPAGALIFAYYVADWPDQMQPPVFPGPDEVNWSELTPITSGDNVNLTGDTNKALVLYAKYQYGGVELLSTDDYNYEISDSSIFAMFVEGVLISGEALPPTAGAGTIELFANGEEVPLIEFDVSYSFGA